MADHEIAVRPLTAPIFIEASSQRPVTLYAKGAGTVRYYSSPDNDAVAEGTVSPNGTPLSASKWLRAFTDNATVFIDERLITAASGPTISAPTSLGPAQTVTFDGATDQWLVGTLNANLVITTASQVAGSRLVLLLTRDNVANRSVTINDVVLSLPTGIGASVVADVRWTDATTFKVTIPSTVAASVLPSIPTSSLQVMEGFGASVRAFTHCDLWNVTPTGVPGTDFPALTTGQKNALYDALHSPTAGIGLTRIRSGELYGDKTLGSTIQPTDGGAYTFTGARLDDVAAQMAEAAVRQPVLKKWYSSIFHESWMTGLTSTTPDATMVGKYADWLRQIVLRYKAQGAPLDYFTIGNEPSFNNGQRNPMSAQFIRDVIKNVGPRLAADGALVPIVLPDDIRASTAVQVIDTVMADSVAASYVGAFASHAYDEPESNWTALASRAATYGMPLWQTEMTGSTLSTMSGATVSALGLAVEIHNMLALYNVSAFDALFGAFGAYAESSNGGEVLLKLTNTGTTYNGYTASKFGDYLGQYARYVRPGMRRFATTTTNSAVKVTAFRDESTKKVTVVVVNPTGSAVTSVIGSTALRNAGALTGTRTSSTEQWASIAGVTPASEALPSTSFAASSVTTYTGTVS